MHIHIQLSAAAEAGCREQTWVLTEFPFTLLTEVLDIAGGTLSHSYLKLSTLLNAAKWIPNPL